MSEEPCEARERRQQAWHLDKRVPIALFAMLFMQTGAAVWWASEINSASREQAKLLLSLSQRLSEVESRERDATKLVERVVRVETIVENVQRTVNRIDSAIDDRYRRK